MVAAYRATNDASYLASARRMADFMIERMMEPSGRMHAIFDAKNDGPVPADANVQSGIQRVSPRLPKRWLICRR
ncbi:MAG: hypothetical protein R3E84_21855 [Pseudomonadales bacterium]